MRRQVITRRRIRSVSLDGCGNAFESGPAALGLHAKGARRDRAAAPQEGQHFGDVRTAQTVPGMGLDADWFPDRTELMTTDGARLISVTVSWPGAKESRARALAEALARTYLGPAHG